MIMQGQGGFSGDENSLDDALIGVDDEITEDVIGGGLLGEMETIDGTTRNNNFFNDGDHDEDDEKDDDGVSFDLFDDVDPL